MNISLLVRDNPSYTIAALLLLYGKGQKYFCVEAPILKILCEQYEKNGYLTNAQTKAAGRILCRFSEEYNNLKPIALEENKEEKIEGKEAWLDGTMIRFKSGDGADVIRTKSLFNRRYSGKTDSYSCSFTLDNIILLKGWGFNLEKDLRRKLKGLRKTSNSIKNELEITDLPGVLRKYQNRGVAFLDVKGGRALLGDDMGLGKTVQALAYCSLYEAERPAVIVTTGSSKLNWKRECQYWLPDESVYICYGKNPKIEEIEEDLIIINYDILTTAKGSKWWEVLLASNPAILIGDEIHKIKNRDTKRTKAFSKLALQIKKFIAMSGTPFDNRPVELFTTINLLAPWLFPSYWAYVEEFCGAFEDNFGWNVSGASNLDKLHERLSYIMIRRLKKDVLKELPDKVRTIIPVDYDKKIYKKGIEEFKKWGQGTWVDKGDENKVKSNAVNPAAGMVEMEKLKYAVAKSKLKAVIEWLENYIESGNKIVVFAHHRDIQQAIMDRFKDIAISSKDHNADYQFQRCANCDVAQEKHTKKNGACNKYTHNQYKIFVGGKDAIEALTLTSANSTLTVEFWWVWAHHIQAEDRVYRIGQDHDSVNAFYIVADGTIENDIMKILDYKRKITEKGLDGKDTKESEMLSNLVSKLV